MAARGRDARTARGKRCRRAAPEESASRTARGVASRHCANASPYPVAANSHAHPLASDLRNSSSSPSKHASAAKQRTHNTLSHVSSAIGHRLPRPLLRQRHLRRPLELSPDPLRPVPLDLHRTGSPPRPRPAPPRPPARAARPTRPHDGPRADPAGPRAGLAALRPAPALGVGVCAEPRGDEVPVWGRGRGRRGPRGVGLRGGGGGGGRGGKGGRGREADGAGWGGGRSGGWGGGCGGGRARDGGHG